MAKKYSGAARTLRTFELPDDLFYEFEYIAEERSRSTVGEIVESMKYAVEKYKTENPDKVKKSGSLPYTQSRIDKMKR